MICLLHMRFIWIILFFWILTALAKGRKEEEDACSDWQLSGGRIENEGFIEVTYRDERVNLCADTSQNLEEVCEKLGKSVDESRNVFNAGRKEKALSFINMANKCGTSEKTNNTCGGDVIIDCCQPAWICCLDNAQIKTCSANWNETLDKPCHHSQGKRFTYSQIRARKIRKMNNSISAWTESALVKQIPEDASRKNWNCSLGKDILRQCPNKCLNSKNVTSLYVGSNGTCLCSGRPQQNDTECYNELQIIDYTTKSDTTEPEERPILCIAAEMISGTITFTAEDCEKFLQPLCLKEFITTTTSSPTTTLMKGDDVSHILTPTIAVFGTVLGFVVLAVCVYKCSKKSNKRDPFHNNSMCNRTYDRQMPKHDDEEYAIISEIELDSGTTFYKPSLPERGNDSSGNTYHTIEHGRDVSNTAVITLDEYSTPSDMITDKCKADPADEYMTTYDDPIRHNLQNTAECKRKSETTDANGNLAQESDNIRDKSFCDSHDGENEISESYEYIVDTKKETSVNEKSLNTVKEQGKEAENDKFFESEESHAVECNFSTPARSVIGATGGNYECFIPTVLEGHSSSAEDKDYEDTNIIDGNFPSRPKDIFEEHVCLHCLKPEHLKRLGIKIIPDKPLEDVERRLSEPQRKTNYSASETDITLRRCLTDVSRKNRKNDLIDFVENTDQDENIRECLVCNNVYDRMGRIREKLDTKNDVNEYDHLSNWKHRSVEKTLMENS